MFAIDFFHFQIVLLNLKLMKTLDDSNACLKNNIILNETSFLPTIMV